MALAVDGGGEEEVAATAAGFLVVQDALAHGLLDGPDPTVVA